MSPIDNAHGFLAGGGEMGGRIRALDWSHHSLGVPQSWPQSLRSGLSICLNTAFPIAIYWGQDRILLYNDAWAPILGTKHPWALGRPGREVWSEIWDVVGPLFDRVAATGEGSFQSDALLAMHRHGYTEECYFDYTFSPIRGETGTVEGVFNAVTETTHRVIEKRRLRTLRDLAAHPRGVSTVAETVDRLLATCAENPIDIPFALLYLVSDKGKSAEFAGATPNVPERLRESPYVLSRADPGGTWAIAEAVRAQAPVTQDATNIPGLPEGYWKEPPTEILVQPVASPGQDSPAAVLVAGINPRRALDDEHRTFYALAGSHIASALADASAFDEEKRRAEALAALDRAKTSFFSNVSHELRTPLTLMLGPLQDALASGAIPPTALADLSIAHRNGQRLLKLVNALLDFSRIEAGRVVANYEPVDIAAFTAELASSFRSAIEKAGMQLIVECSGLNEPVYLDRSMWEKVVLNLLSNAFKYTLEGEIRVAVRAENGDALVTVGDTGVGIPADAMPRLFERFYRVEGTQGRTHEGTGIGLALVNDLVSLHGGHVSAESVLGKGSLFSVRIPFGKSHLPKERIERGGLSHATSRQALSFAEEALSWVDDAPMPADALTPQAAAESVPTATIVLADDNRDMRAYIERLLAARYRVIPVHDGLEALEAVHQERPDLVLSDVMMPRLDGFGLLAALRRDPATAELPVLLVSARAGEESRVEGLSAGADDYLVKPFSGRELLARVDAHLKLSRLRREAAETLRGNERRFRDMIDALPAAVYTTDPEGRVTHFNTAAVRFSGRVPVIGSDQWCISSKLFRADGTPLPHAECPMAVSLRERRPVRGVEAIAERPDGTRVWFEPFPTPLLNEAGELIGGINMLVDITDRKRTEQDRARLSDRLAKELADMERLHAMSLRLTRLDDPHTVMREVLAAAAELVGADRGTAQLYSQDSSTLKLVGVIGFDDAFARQFQSVKASGFTTCAAVLRSKERVIVEDLAAEAAYCELFGATTSYGIRAAMSTPLVATDGSLLGLFTTYWREPHRPSDHELRLLDLYVQQAAQHIERREADDALQKSEERFRALVTTTADVVYRMNADWTEMRQLVGREFIADTLTPSRTWLDKYIHPDDQDAVRAAIADAIRNEGVFQLEHRVLRPNGELAWTFSRAVPLRGEDGEIVEWFGAASDVTRRREEEERNEFLVALDDAIRPLTDPQEITLTAARLLGEHLRVDRCAYADVEADQDTMNLAGNYTRGPEVKSIVGRLRFTDFGQEVLALMRANRPYVVDDIDQHQPPVEDAASYRATQIQAVVCVPLHKHGSFVAAMAVHTMTPRHWQRTEIELVQQVAARCWESIERARVTRNLQESETRLRLAQRAGNVGVFEWNMPQDRIVWSPELEALYGLEAGSFAGGLGEWRRRVAAEDADRVLADIEACVRERRPDFYYEFRAVLPDGSHRWLAGQAQFSYGPHGEPLRMIGVNIDIDDRKRATDELARHRERLQQMVEQRTAELEASHRQLRLSERMAALGTLSAGLGHDMGNLLVPVRVRLEELLKADLPEASRKDVEAIRVSAEYLRRLASGLRMLALDPATGVKGEPTDLRAWWDEAEPMLRSVLPRNVTLDNRVPDRACWALASKAALTQAVFNLVQNAGDALKTKERGSVTVSIDSVPDEVRVSITDDGPGMTPEVKARCMEPFFTTKPRDISTGLGLSLVYGLVREMGGAIALTTAPGEGTRFVLTFPAAEGGCRDGNEKDTARKVAVRVRESRLRALVVAELRGAGYAAETGDSDGVDFFVMDDLAQINGNARGRPVVLLGSVEKAVDGVSAIGAKPSLPVLRRAIQDARNQAARM